MTSTWIGVQLLHIDWAQAQWRRSTRSNGQGDCVEMAEVADAIGVRDSKDPTGSVLVFTRAEWDAFVDGAKNGEFDL